MALKLKRKPKATKVKEFEAAREGDPLTPEEPSLDEVAPKNETDINIGGLDAEEVSLARDERVKSYR